MENIYQIIKYTDKSCSINSPLEAIVKGCRKTEKLFLHFQNKLFLPLKSLNNFKGITLLFSENDTETDNRKKFPKKPFGRLLYLFNAFLCTKTHWD